MKTSELLIQAKAVIADPAKWAQNTYAKNSQGVRVGADNPDAICFCSVGALQKISPKCYGAYALEVWQAMELLDDGCSEDILAYNDTHTHAEVMDVWDKAIQMAIEKEKE